MAVGEKGDGGTLEKTKKTKKRTKGKEAVGVGGSLTLAVTLALTQMDVIRFLSESKRVSFHV